MSEGTPKKQEQGGAQGSSVNNTFQASSISLPKGGGAIRGIGEKFGANPVTGTGSMSVPIATSPGRSGFGPQLSLSYDSGAGNGPFGLGWHLSLPSITRKTDKGIPRYFDTEESDVFILSGAEDLVPCLRENGRPESVPPRTVDGKTYSIVRYRPRIEGLFARIERWTNQGDPADSFWRSISKDNITTWYGRTSESRIFDPGDNSRIFNWLICESHDDKGNVITYGFKEENSAGIDLSQVHERNRTDRSRSANRYLKRIRYGNHEPYFPGLAANQPWPMPPGAGTADAGTDWFFETVFDYGEHDATAPGPNDVGEWAYRNDPFSSCRSGFEVRTYRLCQRVLMFHHFADEAEVGTNALVRSTDFEYSYEENPNAARDPIYSKIVAVTQSGYKRDGTGYLKKSLPPLEFEYTRAEVNEEVREVEPESLENLPEGLDGARYQWVDLDGEGLSGILTEQAGSWFYKRNISALPVREEDGSVSVRARFEPLIQPATIPSVAESGGHHQFLDLAGDGQLDVVVLDRPTPGFYERTTDADWKPFRAFRSLPNIDWKDPDLKFVDLNGDGHADVLITGSEAFTWYPSLAEDGFGSAEKTFQPLDEEQGPRLVFADGTQSIYLADLSGDGLSDLVRIRNGEVCYWPNLGYGRFGARVTMDNAPWFDAPDQFDQKRIRLADIDGSGTTDIIYLHSDGVHLYFNQSGNSWSPRRILAVFPKIDNLSSVLAVDLLGNGTACLVWSSSLPGNAQQPMKYIDLMGGQKPHLLIRSINNLGAETAVTYAPSTRFYLQDKYDGKPWITKLPFPVHVVERVETYDHISKNRFTTRYAYHHGYFDGQEREFRGFGMVEQWDTEEYASFSSSDHFPVGDNINQASNVPPVHSKTWFHTGIYLGRNHVSDYFAGLLDARDIGEYYREPAWRNNDSEARKYLLDDTVLPDGLSVEEAREACRALKGSMLRQEVYAEDGTDKAAHPYTVTEQNFTIRRIQPRGDNRHGVFLAHPREAISYYYERNPADPRVTHAMTFEVDDYGNVLKEVSIDYGRRQGVSPLQGEDGKKQEQLLITSTENAVTHAIDKPVTDPLYDSDHYHTPLPAETRTYEVTGYKLTGADVRFSFGKFADHNFRALTADLTEIGYEKPTDYTKKQKRLIEHVRTLYRKNDLSAFLPFGKIEFMVLPGESYKLAFTPGLLSHVFKRKHTNHPVEDLLPVPDRAALLEGKGADQGGYAAMDGNWWIPSGRVFFDPAADVAHPANTAAQELGIARGHFYLPRKFADPFDRSSRADYDGYDLLVTRTTDALSNTIVAEHDYRVLQPRFVTDPNGNRSAAAFDVLGMLVATAVMGKAGEKLGDLLEGFNPDPSLVDLQSFIADPQSHATSLLGKATTCMVYDPERYQRAGQPPLVATLVRETHFHDPVPSGGLKIQIGFSYSDGFGREIQKKIQAEAGSAPQRQADVPLPGGDDIRPGDLIRDAQGKLVRANTPRRWVGSGRTVFNNKGKPVRKYEPFFSATHLYEPERDMTDTGVSPTLFYDPVGRVVATLHPNHTWEKVVFDPWRQESWDVNDTVTLDPNADDDVRGFFINPDGTPRIPAKEYIPTWHKLRTDSAYAAGFSTQYPDITDRLSETTAATRAAAHAGTPSVAHFDTLGRPFFTLADNGPDPAHPGRHLRFATRVALDIEGNKREVRDAIKQSGDARGRIVMRYDYDMLGNRIHQASMEAGERWMLNDVTGKPIRAWDSRGHTFRTEYDPLRRPLRSLVTGANPAQPNLELLTERLVYGEQHPQAEQRNLRGKLYLYFDQAGIVTTEEHDFKGNPLRATRRLTNGTQYKQTVDWSTVDVALPTDATMKLNAAALEAAIAPLLEVDTYAGRTTYDALNRPVTLTTPHTPTMQPSVIRPGYNEANLLERVDANLRGAAVATPFVTNIDYDAKGQRQRIDYGNGVSTLYHYDPLTFRLVHLLTRRNATDFSGDCPQPPPTGWPGCQVQNLHYTYDPAGNITHIRDDAQQTVYFKNKRVEPSSDYTYDAIYRLIAASGREHLGQVGGAPIPHSHNDAGRVGILSADAVGRFAPNDGKAMGTYIESYVYDAVGNFLEMQHRGVHPANPGWTRSYSYGETSQLEDGTGGTPFKTGNRLTSTTVGTTTATYSTSGDGYDSHGNMLKMPHLPQMAWDYRDQLQRTDLGGGGTAYYVYDAAGQRVRKVWEKSASLVEERIYLGGFEIFRRRNGTGAVTLERETLHVMDDKQRIALVETRTLDTAGTDQAPQQLSRYQLSNHLGSTSLELDDQAQIISYEEYTPYGSTSYQAVRSRTETPKRYRYTGKERDEETGLNYHGARYYAPWLGRWVSADPLGIADPSTHDLSLYTYTNSAPTMATDPTGRQSVFLTDRGAVTPRSPVDVRRPQNDKQRIPPVPPENRKKKKESTGVQKTPDRLLKLAEKTEKEGRRLKLTLKQVEFIVQYYSVAEAEFSKRGLPERNALLLVAQAGVETSFGKSGRNPRENNYLSLQPTKALRRAFHNFKPRIGITWEGRENRRNKTAPIVNLRTPSPHFKDMRQSIDVQIDLVYGINLPKGLRALFPSLGQQLRNKDATPESYGLAAARAGYAGSGTPEAKAYPASLSQQYSVVCKVLRAARVIDKQGNPIKN